MTVHSGSTMTVKFKDGGETHVDIEKLGYKNPQVAVCRTVILWVFFIRNI